MNNHIHTHTHTHAHTHAQRRSHILETAERYVNQDRNSTYDEPATDFGRIAQAWNWWLRWAHSDGSDLEMEDVAAMMILLKLGRLAGNPTHEDSWIDVAGYAACGYDVAMKNTEGEE